MERLGAVFQTYIDTHAAADAVRDKRVDGIDEMVHDVQDRLPRLEEAVRADQRREGK